ncbi:hypothetical protein NDU88_004316 [Pleurodeles waltl]|uniref:t-SNARE coiled-coil homology domain-containing protein n=1 Tax=Pleurodeles waltl TaxID=8319 RepID=A0AAV7PC41_PLEWA|nr:hypothetical protein NDU88_004316 [Pleurodeles waltl]
MGKTDKVQEKLQFEQHKTPKVHNDGSHTAAPDLGTLDPKMSNDVRQILGTRQQSLTTIGKKMDSLSYRMDRMSESVDKHAEWFDIAERCISDIEDDRVAGDGTLK